MSTNIMKFNPFSQEFKDNPLEILDFFRRKDPIHFFQSEEFGNQRSWLITRYEDAELLLKDSRLVVDPRGILPEEAERGFFPTPELKLLSDNLLSKDGEDHMRLRKLVQKAFTPQMILKLTNQIEEICNELVNSMEGKKTIDLMEEYARPLPIAVISKVLGVPSEDYDLFTEWANVLTDSSAQNLEIITPKLREFIAYLDGIIEEKRKCQTGDLISELVKEINNDKLHKSELYSMIFFLIVAGYDTTVNLIGNGMLNLLRNPVEYTFLKNNPETIESAIEELLRTSSPILLSKGRWAKESFEYKSFEILKGDVVIVSNAAANHDPVKFENPYSLNLKRINNKHLSFGKGEHHCLGAFLARLESKIAFLTLINRLPTIELSVDLKEIMWRDSPMIRSLEKLPITI
ncbi:MULTISPECIES: cytochrome P450 family protein [Bacillus]|uniref:cytochrome P450 family protein n=1 Tax=Bacillus TaxID=1386 RepID=UPI0005567F77|nr:MULTISPECIES: cytochrome P450 [Bacillus]KOA77233.1 hypothetical protein ACR53_11855 [Bacillus stratosphericus]MBU4620433.1 cytochrome P450 [Bacillus sp. GG161]